MNLLQGVFASGLKRLGAPEMLSAERKLTCGWQALKGHLFCDELLHNLNCYHDAQMSQVSLMSEIKENTEKIA